MGGISHVFLKIASALNVKVMEIPTNVDASELWLRDDLEEVNALLFGFLGYGFRLAKRNVGWLVTQKFVNLVPDSIGVSPSWSLRGGTRVSSGLIARQIEERLLLCFLCRAADVQRSGPGPGRQAHEAV